MTVSSFTLKTTLVFVSLLSLISAVQAGTTSEWAPQRACQNTFIPKMTTKDEINSRMYAMRISVLDKSITDLNHKQSELVEHAFRLFHPETYSTPKLEFIFGDKDTGKTFVLTKSVLPILKTLGLMGAHLDAADFLAATKAAVEASEAQPLYEDFTVFVLDGVDFANLRFEQEKQIFNFAWHRFHKGLSTIISTKGSQKPEELLAFTKDISAGALEFSGTTFEASKYNDTVWRK